jgi:hypothetical protein
MGEAYIEALNHQHQLFNKGNKCFHSRSTSSIDRMVAAEQLQRMRRPASPNCEAGPPHFRAVTTRTRRALRSRSVIDPAMDKNVKWPPHPGAAFAYLLFKLSAADEGKNESGRPNLSRTRAGVRNKGPYGQRPAAQAAVHSPFSHLD